MAIDTSTVTSTPRPQWLLNLVTKYQSHEGHAFLLTGRGIHDADATSNTLHSNGYQVFGNKTIQKPSLLDFDIVVRYDRHNGFRFMGSSERRIAARESFKALIEKSDAPASQIGGGSAISSIRGGPAGGGAPKGDILDRSKNPAMAIPLIGEALAQAEVRVCVILDEFQSLAPRGEWSTIGDMFSTTIIALRSWGLDYETVGGYGRAFKGKRGGHLLIGVCDDKSSISTEIASGAGSSGWVSISSGAPTFAEREYFVREKVLTEAFREKVSVNFEIDGDDATWLASATGGLSIRALENVRLLGQTHGELNRDMISKLINETISEQFSSQGGSDYLQVINPRLGLRDYGFPEYLVEYLQWFLRQFRAGKLRNANILEVGPPGTGKSLLAYALAAELGYKCVHWSPALTQSKWVGDSEKQLMQVLDWVESNLPCMMFIDEIDVALTSRDGGSIDTSGVGGKMLSILMPWLEKDEIKGKLLLVGATNRADNIDAAMRRRLQTVIPVLPPMLPEERHNVLLNVLRREQGITGDIEIPAEVVADSATRWYTQANLSVLAQKAASVASRRDEEFSDNVAHYLRLAIANYRVDTARTETLSYLAASQASDLDLLPPGFEVKRQAEVKAMVKSLEDDDDGAPVERQSW